MRDELVNTNTTEGEQSSIKCLMLNSLNYTIWVIRMKNLLKVHNVWSIIETATKEEHPNFKPLMTYTRTAINVNKLVENVLVFEEAEKVLEKAPENLQNESMNAALIKKHTMSGKKDLDRAEAVFNKMRELGLLLKPSPFSSMKSLFVGNKVIIDEILIEKKICDEFVKRWVDQKELTDLHSKIPTMYMHEINMITSQIYIGRGRILVNCRTRFAKLTVVKKDGYRVANNVCMKVLLERSRFFIKKMSCRREKGVSHMVEINECDDVEIYVETVVLIYCNDLKKKLISENVVKILALLMVSAMLYDERVMSCLEHCEAIPWSEDGKDILVSCLYKLHLPENSVIVILHRVLSEPTRSRTDDILLNLLTGVVQAKVDKSWREMKVLFFKLFREPNHEFSKDTIYVLCHRCLVTLGLCLSEAITQINNSGKDHGALMGQISGEADNMLWMVDNMTRKKYNKDICKDHKALGELRRECECAKRALSNQYQVRVKIEFFDDKKRTSKKSMDYLALKEVATDRVQAKEKLVVVETKREAARLDSKERKEKHKEVRKEVELLKNTSERLKSAAEKNTSERLKSEAEESLLAWNWKEFVRIIKRGEDEKSSLLDENNRLLVALVAAENLRKKTKDENMTVVDIPKPVISKANMAKEVVTKAENSILALALLDKEEELQFALKEVERVKINEAVDNDNFKKFKNLLSEVEVAMEEEKHKSLSRQESMHKELEVKVLRTLRTEVEAFSFGEVELTEGENIVLEKSCVSLVGIRSVITYGEASFYGIAVCCHGCPLVDFFSLMNQKVRGFSWVTVLTPRHVLLMGYFWILDIMEKGSSSFMCLPWIHILLSSLSTRMSYVLYLIMTIQVTCYCDFLVNTRDHTFTVIVNILVGRLVFSKELSMYNGELPIVEVKKSMRMVFLIQSIMTHGASVEQMDAMLVCVHSPTFGVAQYENNKVTKGGITSFSSLDSRDVFGNKDVISVAGDLKVLLNESKVVGILYIKEVRSVHSDDEERGMKKIKEKTWYLQKQETMVLNSCEVEFMVSIKAFGIFMFKEARNLIGVQDLSKSDFKLKGENVGLSLKKKGNLRNKLTIILLSYRIGKYLFVIPNEFRKYKDIYKEMHMMLHNL